MEQQIDYCLRSIEVTQNVDCELHVTLAFWRGLLKLLVFEVSYVHRDVVVPLWAANYNVAVVGHDSLVL